MFLRTSKPKYTRETSWTAFTSHKTKTLEIWLQEAPKKQVEDQAL
jgi:hypothetical protein